LSAKPLDRGFFLRPDEDEKAEQKTQLARNTALMKIIPSFYWLSVRRSWECILLLILSPNNSLK